MMDIESSRPHKWPQLLDMTKEECQKSLRALEISAYSQMISVLRAQGELTKEKKKLLNDLQNIFSINLERHRAEIRRAVNDEKLNTIAETLAGPNTGVEWAVEGRRLIPLMPRVPPQTAYTALATRMAMLYYNMNSKMPPPAATAHYGKFDDLGCESDATDSEEETEGLRFISGAMVPQQYNADQGLYTTLPQSQARIARISSKENRENREAPTTTTASSVSSGPMSMGPMAMGSAGSDKRKRKRSLSTDHPLPPPPPQPVSREQPLTPNTPTKPQIGGISRPIPGPPMKITVTGNVTRGTPGTPTSTLGGHTQKVILVSTSGASGVGGNMYQRSLTVPVMKGGPGAPPTVMRGMPAGPGPISSNQMQTGGSIGSSSNVMVPTSYASGGQSASGGGIPQPVMPPGTYVNRMRPRVPSGALPPRPRQRSNSLVLHTEPTMPQRGVEANSGSGSGNMGSSSHLGSVPGFSGGPPGMIGSSAPSSHTVPPSHLMTHQTIQVRPGPPVTPGKAIQIRQEATGAKIITHTVGGSGSGLGGPSNISSTGGTSSTGGLSSNTPSRLMGRPPLLPPNSPQGTGGPLYVVTTNSGTITVVTRTVAAGQGTGPRVVTVNTINAPKSSVGGVRAASPATVVSVGPKTVQTVRVTPQGPAGLRPVLGSAKSNVIVVHKGAPHGTRPVGIQGIRDVPTKITIGKTLGGNANTAVLQKPPPAPRGTVGSSNVVSSGPQTSQGNVIVVDMSGAEGNAVSNPNSLADILQATGILDAAAAASGSSSATNTNSSSTNASGSASTTSTTALSTRSLAVSAMNTSTSAGGSSIEKNSTSGSRGQGGGESGEGEGEWLNLGLESGDSPGQSLPEGQMQMLEEAVEILGRGDKESARNLLRQAGIELLDSPGDIVEQGGEAASMASLISGLSSQLPGGHIDGSALPPVGELDPATGFFYNPSSTESSSDSNSNSDMIKAGKITVALIWKGSIQRENK
ncbi:BRCA2-interacting transcriptional repressor EMSY isoform X4 [Palaemon carinicauda]|uniref:BRCA2-interacting transcriptional repressor EMSY isoform X4 n=1 Tax=Palaemon carinicauda TaxID=392227 RepID=UPI0035B64BD7